MAYKSYWDYEEEERAKLSDTEVETLLKYELMEKGVLNPPPLELEPEEPSTIRRNPYYKVVLKFKSWSTDEIPVLFNNPIDARAFLEMDWVFEDYEHCQHCARVRTEQEIKSVELPWYQSVVEQQAAIQKAQSAKSRNERRTREHEEALRAVANATDAIWSDWHRCMNIAALHDGIRDVYHDYFEMVEDSDVALKFLLKVKDFNLEDIVKALPEHGVRLYVLADKAPEPGIPEKVEDDEDEVMSTDDPRF